VTTAFLFAGQGVGPPWIAPDLLARPRARELLNAASEASGCDVGQLLLRGGAALERTEVLQPALVCACAIAADALAEAGVAPDVVCGHSLGELAAWSAGGHVAATDAIAAAAIRGRLMAWQAARHPGGMAVATASPGFAGARSNAKRCEESIDLQRVLEVGRAKGRLVVAGYNTPAEITVSGDLAAIAAVAAIGCKRLPVAGAWHSEAMADAVDELRATLDTIPRSAGVRFVCNRDGTVAHPERIPELLAAQLVRPIRWTACAKTLSVLGVTRFVAVGPGRLVRAMLRANLGDIDVRIFAGMRDLARVVAP